MGNGFYILLATTGWSAVQHFPRVFALIQLAGALYLLWLGYQLTRSAAGESAFTATHARAAPAWPRQVLLGLGSSLLNPKNILFYISLMAGILGPDVTPLQQWVCGGWMFSVVLAWDVFIALLIGLPPVQLTLRRYLYRIERGAGAILMVFGMILLFGR